MEILNTLAQVVMPPHHISFQLYASYMSLSNHMLVSMTLSMQVDNLSNPYASRHPFVEEVSKLNFYLLPRVSDSQVEPCFLYQACSSQLRLCFLQQIVQISQIDTLLHLKSSVEIHGISPP